MAEEFTSLRAKRSHPVCFNHWIASAFGLAMTVLLSVAPAHAESIKIALTKLLSYPSVPIAIERGYFKEQGLDPLPASTGIQAILCRPELLIDIEAIAMFRTHLEPTGGE